MVVVRVKEQAVNFMSKIIRKGLRETRGWSIAISTLILQTIGVNAFFGMIGIIVLARTAPDSAVHETFHKSTVLRLLTAEAVGILQDLGLDGDDVCRAAEFAHQEHGGLQSNDAT